MKIEDIKKFKHIIVRRTYSTGEVFYQIMEPYKKWKFGKIKYRYPEWVGISKWIYCNGLDEPIWMTTTCGMFDNYETAKQFLPEYDKRLHEKLNAENRELIEEVIMNDEQEETE